MFNIPKFLLVAFLCWLVPFVVSLPIFGPDGQLLINFWLFKALMVVVLSLTAFLSLRWFYRRASLTASPSQALLIGVGILFSNVALDSVTILQLNPLPLVSYGSQIGLVYLLFIPISLLTARTNKGEIRDGT